MAVPLTEAEIRSIYDGSNGDATKALYLVLEAFGPRGVVALNLFRACKASERAKNYRRGFSRMAYDRKAWSMANLCKALDETSLSIAWGWGYDAKAINFEHVLYVEVPAAGQVSFHTDHRGRGPDYGREWDGVKNAAPDRICKWCAAILAGITTEGDQNGLHTRTERDPAPRAEGSTVRNPEEQKAFDF